MIRGAIIGVAILGFFSIACYADGSSSGLRVVTQTFDPPITTGTVEWITSLTAISGFRGAAGLILRVPCFRQDLLKRAVEERTYPQVHFRTPGLQSWCRPQRIPRGAYAGRYVDEHGRLFARQTTVPGGVPPVPDTSQKQMEGGAILQVFDPPVEIEDSSWMISLTTVRRFPGAPGLILQVPCFSGYLGVQPSPGPTRIQTIAMPRPRPRYQSSCAPQRVPRGDDKGLYAMQDGYIVPPPP